MRTLKDIEDKYSAYKLLPIVIGLTLENPELLSSIEKLCKAMYSSNKLPNHDQTALDIYVYVANDNTKIKRYIPSEFKTNSVTGAASRTYAAGIFREAIMCIHPSVLADKDRPQDVPHLNVVLSVEKPTFNRLGCSWSIPGISQHLIVVPLSSTGQYVEDLYGISQFSLVSSLKPLAKYLGIKI